VDDLVYLKRGGTHQRRDCRHCDDPQHQTRNACDDEGYLVAVEKVVRAEKILRALFDQMPENGGSSRAGTPRSLATAIAGGCGFVAALVAGGISCNGSSYRRLGQASARIRAGTIALFFVASERKKAGC
jgi:hypothetical protein